MNDIEHTSPNRQTVINGLAVAGFVALVAAGIWLAVYSTRYVPSVVGSIGAAAVSLGSVFNPAPDSSLTVIPTASTTISFGDDTPASTTSATTTPAVATPVTTAPATTKPVTPSAGSQTTGTYPIGTTTAPGTAYGLPDLVVNITATGYLLSASADTFIASTTVPAGARPAVRFTIRNVGTNVTGAWRFSASIPTQTAYIFQSQPQQSLGSGDSIDYTLGFDQANRGYNQMISITANFDHAVGESITTNNSAAATVTILGS